MYITNVRFWSKFNQYFGMAVFAGILIFFLSGCKSMKSNTKKGMSVTYYFSSPAAAIPIITELLEKKNFKILAKYYDLSNSEIELSELESGDFFIRKERPEVAHPAGSWRYKHPFAPEFSFSNVQSTAKDGIYIIEVSLSIDQGQDFPEQIGLSYFYMIKTDKGWKILPNQVTANDIDTEMPDSDQ